MVNFRCNSESPALTVSVHTLFTLYGHDGTDCIYRNIASRYLSRTNTDDVNKKFLRICAIKVNSEFHIFDPLRKLDNSLLINQWHYGKICINLARYHISRLQNSVALSFWG